MKNRKWKNLYGVGVLLTVLCCALWSYGCGDDDLLAREPSMVVNLQETTATVTATWRYTAPGSDSWTMADEWRSSRVSGGDNWTVTGVSGNRTATFTVPRSISSNATGAFCVIPVRTDPQPGRFTERCADFVVPMQTIPDAEIDSLTIGVTDASGAIRSLGDSGVVILFSVSPATGDTTWKYTAFLADGDSLKDLVVQTGIEHTGIQLTALLWKDNEVVGCNGGCAMFPDSLILPGCVEGVDCDDAMGWYPQGPIVQAYNPLPPLRDVLGQ